ncbi:MAG: PRC-barrel domain-containing protein [Thermomicrobiales bacterium]
MTIELGADIIGSDGAKLGVVDSIVIDPTGGEERAIIVRRGWFFPTDKIVPIDLVDHVDHGKVHVRLSTAEADQMMEYLDADYVMPPAGYYGAGGYMWPATPYIASDLMVDDEIHQRMPNAVMLSEGTMVVDKDEHEVGRITEIASDAQRRVQGFRVEQGFFRHHERYIPANLIERADDVVVHLSVDKSSLAEVTGAQTTDAGQSQG